jgi:hypothetical protein
MANYPAGFRSLEEYVKRCDCLARAKINDKVLIKPQFWNYDDPSIILETTIVATTIKLYKDLYGRDHLRYLLLGINHFPEQCTSHFNSFRSKDQIIYGWKQSGAYQGYQEPLPNNLQDFKWYIEATSNGICVDILKIIKSSL